MSPPESVDRAGQEPTIGLLLPVVTAVSATCGAAAGAVLVATGARPELVVGGAVLLRIDAVAAVVGLVLALVAATVALYARRNLDGDPRALRFGVAASALIAATMAMVGAARLSVLVVAWVMGSIATVALCGYRGDARARAAARRMGRAVLAGDLALVVALLLVVAVGGDPELSDLAPVPDQMGAGLTAAVVALIGLAALARAGQFPFSRWLVGTVSAPTPVSALLHAGAVNAGGILLVRTAPLLGAASMVGLALGAALLVGIARSWTASASRPDLKGALAESTGAQMGFMLLACAAGAPVAALSHLAGHALYKSARFLGAGEAIALNVSGRRFGPTATPAGLPSLATGTAGAIIGAGVWWWLSARAGVPSPDRWLVGFAVAATVGHAAQALVRRRPLPSTVVAASALASALAIAVPLGADAVLAGAVSHSGRFLDAPLAVGALVVLALAHHVAPRIVAPIDRPDRAAPAPSPAEAEIDRLAPDHARAAA